jgi:hypothetical protein
LGKNYRKKKKRLKTEVGRPKSEVKNPLTAKDAEGRAQRTRRKKELIPL